MALLLILLPYYIFQVRSVATKPPKEEEKNLCFERFSFVTFVLYFYIFISCVHLLIEEQPYGSCVIVCVYYPLLFCWLSHTNWYIRISLEDWKSVLYFPLSCFFPFGIRPVTYSIGELTKG